MSHFYEIDFCNGDFAVMTREELASYQLEHGSQNIWYVTTPNGHEIEVCDAHLDWLSTSDNGKLQP